MIRDQLHSMQGQYRSKNQRDIRAITINRIPQDYAYPYPGMDDTLCEQGKKHYEIGRAQFGPISIADTDFEARAYLDAAINAALWAVEEQTA